MNLLACLMLIILGTSTDKENRRGAGRSPGRWVMRDTWGTWAQAGSGKALVQEFDASMGAARMSRDLWWALAVVGAFVVGGLVGVGAMFAFIA